MTRCLTAFLAATLLSLLSGNLLAQVPLDDRQLSDAIREGSHSKSEKKYFEKAMKHSQCKWSGMMSGDGIEKHIIFLSGFDLVAGAAARAQAEMRSFGLADARALGVPDAIYAIVTMKARGLIGRQKLHNRYAPGLHLVLESRGARIQPIEKDTTVVGEAGYQRTLYTWYTTGGMTYLTGLPLGAEELRQSFAFPVSPWEVTNDVNVLAVDADGNRKELTCSMREMRHSGAPEIAPPSQ